MMNRVAEFAIYIGDETYRGKGFLKKATTETMRFAFHKLGLNRIYLRVLEDNLTVIKLNQAFGFRKEGVLRNSVFNNNLFHQRMGVCDSKNEFNG
jgi:diamine N-acetyltransferase